MDVKNIEKIEFQSFKLTEPVVVYINSNVCKRLFKVNDKDIVEGIIKKQYAYSSVTELLGKKDLNLDDRKIFYAERYGGNGLGVNGGAGRCGNLDSIQVKGIGATPLVGDSDDIMHSYGGLTLVDAIYECIFSVVLNIIMPLGTVDCIGIIFTGEEKGYLPDPSKGKCRGALLIREVVPRPGHFLPAPNFQVQKKYQNSIYSDLSRTRKVNKNLQSNFKTSQDYVSYIGRFLLNCANQFSFAKVFGIYHGTITESNISFDGRWLDLTTVSFIESGVDYYVTEKNPSFYQEHFAPLNIAKELLYQYGKFNFTKFNFTPLIKYYDEQYRKCFSRNFLFFMGFDIDEKVEIFRCREFNDILKRYQDVVFHGKEKVEYKIELEQKDYLAKKFVENCFSEINILLPEKKLCQDFNALVNFLYQNRIRIPLSKESFITTVTIRAFTRVYYKHMFYRQNVQKFLEEKISGIDLSMIQNIIECYEKISRWLYKENSYEECTIFENSKLKVSFLPIKNHYYIRIGESVFFEKNVRQLHKIVSGIEDDAFEFIYQNFKKPVLNVLMMIQRNEDNKYE